MIMRSRKVRAAQKSGKLTVLFDSGIRTGSDIIKALAMGAQGVLSQSTRPFLLSAWILISGQFSQLHVRSCMVLLLQDSKVSSRS